jgi:hypothetical protein
MALFRRGRRIDPDVLLDVLTDLAETHGQPGLRLRLLDPLSRDPLVSVEDDERRVRQPLSELVRLFEQHRIAPDASALAAAARDWLDRRPLTDAAAQQHGVAVLGWRDRGRTHLSWQIVVPRRASAGAWIPSPMRAPLDIAAIRALAMQRSATQPASASRVGDVAVWAHHGYPAISSAPAANPERMLAEMQRLLLPVHDVHLVIAPASPLVAAGRTAALRLAEEAVDPCLVVPLSALNDLEWT